MKNSQNLSMLSNCSKIIHYKQSLIEIYFELVRYKNKSDYFILFDRISKLLKMLKTDMYQMNFSGGGGGGGGESQGGGS